MFSNIIMCLQCIPELSQKLEKLILHLFCLLLFLEGVCWKD